MNYGQRIGEMDQLIEAAKEIERLPTAKKWKRFFPNAIFVFKSEIARLEEEWGYQERTTEIGSRVRPKS